MKKQSFKEPFIGTANISGVTLLYSQMGEYSAIFKLENPILQYDADPDLYKSTHALYGQIIKILGENYIMQKTDIITKSEYEPPKDFDDEYLNRKYFEHFRGRRYNTISTYLTITKQIQGSRFYTYNQSETNEFINNIIKIKDTLNNNNIDNRLLDSGEINELHSKFIGINFNDKSYFVGNVKATNDGLEFNDNKLEVISLFDIDEMNLPNQFKTNTTNENYGNNFPLDNLSWLFQIPDTETIIYDQTIIIPHQSKTRKNLEAKQRKHSNMPDHRNNIAVEEINEAFIDIAKNNEMLVYCNFKILAYAAKSKIGKVRNYIATSLFSLGITPSKNTYNQLELFRASIPGNAGEIKEYDLFLTSRPAASCFIFNENLPKSEKSSYKLYFTDRQGIPIAIDTSEVPMHTNRINNRNKFVLGPSGTGKSFFMNRYVKQCKTLGADVILVDTGHSYKRTCTYFGGKYITYTEDRPITMNPFKIKRVEYNEQKREMLKSLIGVIWKGTGGILSQVEETILTDVITAYYSDYFGNQKIVKDLSFNSFYEYSVTKIKETIKREEIVFPINEYRYILKQFYQGGTYETILNDDFDNTLFDEPFIVFEIDSIKDHKKLFPITTLIIMDVFYQKMHHKPNKKILVIEEAWKAIASPMMAQYILYLYKTVRKFSGEAIVVTQELSDIIDNVTVKDSILSNSDTICLLDQSNFKEHFDEIQTLLNISDIEKRKLFTVNQLDNKQNRSRFKEVYIRRGNKGEVYGVEVSIEEYLTYTTERSEKEALQVYLTYYNTYEEAMETVVADLKKSGLELPDFSALINKNETVFSQINTSYEMAY